MNIYEPREKTINFLKAYYPMISNDMYDARYGKIPKMSTPKQILQKVPIALALVKSGNTSEKLLNEIWQIIYSLHQKSIHQYNRFNKVIKQNRYYIYEF